MHYTFLWRCRSDREYTKVGYFDYTEELGDMTMSGIFARETFSDKEMDAIIQNLQDAGMISDFMEDIEGGKMA